MSYWVEIKDSFIKNIDHALSTIKESVGEAIDFGKEEAHLVGLKKDLFLKHRELHNTLADLGDKTKEAYNEKGNIYRDDIGDYMQKVSIIENECLKIQHEIDHIHDK